MPSSHSGQENIARPAALGWRELKGERSITTPRHVLAKRFFVGRENPHALPPSGDGYIPLLRVRGCPNRRVRKEHVIDGLALRAVGSNSVASHESAVASWQNAPVHELDLSVCSDLRNGDKFAVGELHPRGSRSIGLELQSVATAK